MSKADATARTRTVALSDPSSPESMHNACEILAEGSLSAMQRILLAAQKSEKDARAGIEQVRYVRTHSGTMRAVTREDELDDEQESPGPAARCAGGNAIVSPRRRFAR